MELGAGQTRVHHGRRHPGTAQLGDESLCEGAHPGLMGGIGPHGRQRRDAGDIENGAVPARHHTRERRMGEFHDRAHHDRQGAALLSQIASDEDLPHGEPRVVDEQIDRTGGDIADACVLGRGRRARHGGLQPQSFGDGGQALGGGQVRGQYLDADAGDLAELLGDGGEALPTARDQDQIVMGLCQLPRQFEPDAGGGSGDQCGSHGTSLDDRVVIVRQ